MERKGREEQFKRLWEKYKFILLVAAVGVVFLVWPTGGRAAETPAADSAQSKLTETLEETEARMEKILSRISGAGELHLMLTVERSAEDRLAQDTQLSYSGEPASPEDYERRSETVLTDGDGGDTPVVTGSAGPVYRGALVVCQGAGDAQVRLAVTNAVAALTGLRADRITVVVCQ
jgi:stage III sporulation protein AG